MNDLRTLTDPVVENALGLLNPYYAPDLERALNHQLSLQARDRNTQPRITERTSFMDRLLARFSALKKPMPGIPVAAATILILSLFTSPVQGLANQFLTIFRVQDFAIVNIPSGLQAQSFLGTLPDLSMFGDMQPAVATAPQPQPVTTVDTASSAVGFALHVPGALPATVQSQPGMIRVAPGQTYSFTFRTAKAQAYLQSINRTDVSIPPKFDGSSLQLTVPPIAILAYLAPGTDPTALNQGAAPSGGSGGPAGGASRRASAEALASSITVFEVKSPTVEASGVSYEDLRAFLLTLPNLPASAAEVLRSLPDSSTTLPVPVPPGVSAQKIQVGGAPGVIFADTHDRLAGGVLWQSGGILYGVAGPLNQADLLSIANSMRT